jgi:beta-lactamase regulating signal transducer with metallopeptidase domain
MSSILAALVNGMLVSGALAWAVWIALRLVPGNWLNAATRYAIWWAVLVVTVALPFSYFRGSAVASGGRKSVASPAVAGEPLLARSPRRAESGGSTVVATASRSALAPLRGEFRSIFPVAIPASRWAARILAVWFVTSMLMLTRLVGSMVMLERRKGRASEAPPILAARVSHWLRSCGGSRRRIRLASSNEISVPLVAGPLSPSILLPARLLGELSECELEQIGIHEAAHIVRRDDFALLVQRMVEAMFALHPVVHWVTDRMDLEREIACDDFVIAATGDSKPYAACLARVVEISGGVRAFPVAAAAAEDRSHLARRVEMLLDSTRNTGTRLTGLRLAIAAAGLAMLTWGAAQTPGFVEFVQPRATLIARAQAFSPVLVAPTTDITSGDIASGDIVPGDSTVPAPRRFETALLAQAARPVVPASPPQAAPVVFVPVEVRDPMNRYVTGLDQDVFRVEENGVEQTITSISSAGEGTDIVVIADPRLGGVSNGMDLNPANSVVVTFDVSLKSVSGAKRMINRDADVRKAILILTTKDTSWQSYTEAEARTVADESTMPVYVIEVSDSEGTDRTMLTELALRTGGRHIAVSRPEDVAEAYRGVLIAVRNLYFVGYVSSNTERGGGYRSLNVSVGAPRGLPKLTARSRLGYVAAAQ